MNVNHLSTASWNPDTINNEPKVYLGKSCIWGKACLSEVVSQNTKSKAVLFLISANKCSSLPLSEQPLRLLCFPRAHTLTCGTTASLLTSSSQPRTTEQWGDNLCAPASTAARCRAETSLVMSMHHPLPGVTSPRRICFPFPTHSQRAGQHSSNEPSCLHDHPLVISTQDRWAQMSSHSFGCSKPARSDQNKPGNNCSWESGYERAEFCERCCKFLYATSTPLINAQGLVQIMQLPDALLPVSFTRSQIHETPCVPDLTTSISLFKYFCMLWSQLVLASCVLEETGFLCNTEQLYIIEQKEGEVTGSILTAKYH